MSYEYRMVVPAELMITIASDEALTTEELKAQAEKVIREYCDETPGMDLNNIDGYDARLYPVLTDDNSFCHNTNQIYGFECVDTCIIPDDPTECECDNTHEQNETVCRFCWNNGIRFTKN